MASRHAASGGGSPGTRAIAWPLREPGEELLCIDAQGFPPEGDDCDAVLLREAYQVGWKRFVVYRLRGQRFHGVGLGAATDGVRIDLYGSNGDYTASGMDGLEIHIHGNAQDQVAQIAKRGKLVIYGDVGQTFMYGAKGGEVYVLGNGAGRPLINAVGRPRVVINGTCLDFLAESFMAGDPLAGGGFVILNGIEFDGERPHGPAGGAVPGQQPVLAGQRRRDLHPRPAPQGGRAPAQRRRVLAAGRQGLAADPPLPGGERAALRHPGGGPADGGRRASRPRRRSIARSAP